MGTRISAAADAARLSLLLEDFAASIGCDRQQALIRLEAIVGLARPDTEASGRAVRMLQKMRARRNALLGVHLFRDPAWDMLLELVAARIERRAVTVSTLCVASGVPQTTALRHLDRMEDAEVVIRSGDFSDQRRVLVALTPAMVPTIETMVAEMRAAFAAAAAGDLQPDRPSLERFALPPRT